MNVSQKKDKILKLLFELDGSYKDYDREKLVTYIADKYTKKLNAGEINLFLEILIQDEFLDSANGLTIKGKDFYLNGGYSKEAEIKKREVHWLMRAVVIAVIGVSLPFIITWMTKKKTDPKYNEIYQKALSIDSMLNIKIRLATIAGKLSLAKDYSKYREEILPQTLNGHPDWILIHADSIVLDLEIIEFQLSHDSLE